MDVTEVEGATLYCADALEVLRHLPDNSVDLIATDPPYYRVKDLSWDRAWDTADGFLAWISQLADEWQRVLRPNGSLYCFASPKMAARVEVEIGKRLNVLSSITWTKPNAPGFDGWLRKSKKESLRNYFPKSERIIFAERKEIASITIRNARCKAGLTQTEICRLLGFFGSINRGGTVANWELGLNIPNEDQWLKLSSLLSLPEYRDVVRSFSVEKTGSFTDVWNFETVRPYAGKHVCEKPLDLCEHIILASSRPGAVVLDSFCGSGAFGHAAVKHGRTFIGSDNDPHWIEKAASRIAALSIKEKSCVKVSEQMDLAI